MTIEIIISSAIVSALIAAIANIITAHMARRTAKETAHETASREIEKLELTWAREDNLSADDEFGEMVRLVVLYAAGTISSPYDALAAIAALRIKEAGEITVPLDALYQAVKQRNREEIDQQLDFLISVRRSNKSGN